MYTCTGFSLGKVGRYASAARVGNCQFLLQSAGAYGGMSYAALVTVPRGKPSRLEVVLYLVLV
jgi:hypothetical protein